MTDVAGIKRELRELGAATELGFDAGGEAVERIKALAAALEAANPTPEPARQAGLLKGRWRLIYSSFGLQRDTTLARLSFNLLPKDPIRVEAIFQEVDPDTGLYDNPVEFMGADGRRGTQVTIGRFEPVDGHRLDVRFTHAMVAGGERVVLDNAKLPPMHSDVTYLDDGFRLNRGGFGNLYVLERVDPAPARWSRDG